MAQIPSIYDLNPDIFRLATGGGMFAPVRKLRESALTLPDSAAIEAAMAAPNRLEEIARSNSAYTSGMQRYNDAVQSQRERQRGSQFLSLFGPGRIVNTVGLGANIAAKIDEERASFGEDFEGFEGLVKLDRVSQDLNQDIGKLIGGFQEAIGSVFTSNDRPEFDWYYPDQAKNLIGMFPADMSPEEVRAAIADIEQIKLDAVLSGLAEGTKTTAASPEALSAYLQSLYLDEVKAKYPYYDQSVGRGDPVKVQEGTGESLQEASLEALLARRQASQYREEYETYQEQERQKRLENLVSQDSFSDVLGRTDIYSEDIAEQMAARR